MIITMYIGLPVSNSVSHGTCQNLLLCNLYNISQLIFLKALLYPQSCEYTVFIVTFLSSLHSESYNYKFPIAVGKIVNMQTNFISIS